MANPCECPPVASRGLFKYLTYLIPIRQCSQHRGPGIVYRGIVKLREGASVVNYYISSVPVGSVASYLSTVDFGSSILNCIIAKCSFFLNVIKPPLEKLVTYIGNYYSTEHEIPEDETASVGESTGKVSKSHSKQSEADIISARSVGSAKTVSTTKSGGSAKSTGSEKSKVSEKSAGSEKSTVSNTSAGLEKFTISEKSIGIEKPIFLEKTTDSVKSKGSATSSDIKSGQVKLVPDIAKQPTVEPPRITPEVDTKWSQLKSRIRRSLENILRAIQYVLNVILSALQYVFNLILKPFEVTFTGMVNILKGTKDKFVSAGTCTYDYLANCPLWIYIYILFVCLTVGYIIYQTYITYKGRLWSQATKIPTRIREGCKEFIIPDSTLKQVMAKLRTEIDKGLNPKTKPSSSVKCFTTYVQDLPSGEENGKFLALDLGGTNFRVLLITLNGRHFDMQSKIYVIPQDVMVGTSKNLFNHIAECLADFTTEHKVSKDNLPLGFTFSFPLKQEGLSRGILQRWTKGFNCPEAIGEDVVELLREAIHSHGNLHIDIMAILNDTTGTLMSCAWKNHNTKIGVILGTGTNACYVEKIENVIDFDGDKSKPIVLINTEWGAFGDNGELDFIRTPFDKEVDSHSINPGSQIHEKLISGMYLGEIVRLLLVKFISENLILEGKLNEQIQQRGTVPSEFLSVVESDKRGCFKECKKALAKIGYTQVSDEDCNSIRFVCECVSRRAAHLASAALATLINKMGYSSLTIGVDGSLYRYHPHFHDLMVQKISQLIDDKIMNVNLMLSEDGSGRGAALVAASLY